MTDAELTDLWLVVAGLVIRIGRRPAFAELAGSG